MKRVVLLAGGTFNPITIMHLRMLELAKHQLERDGKQQVIGGILSPTHDRYGKNELLSAHHRCRMIELAVERSPWLRLSRWECDEQSEWSRLLTVLHHHRSEQLPDIELRFVCGADVLRSFSVPGLWLEEDVERIVVDYGIVCVTRQGEDVAAIIRQRAVLERNRERIETAVEWNENRLSSTAIRKAVRRGDSIAYLVPDGVAEYIAANRLYQEALREKLVFLFKSDDSDRDSFSLELAKSMQCVVIPTIEFVYRNMNELSVALRSYEKYSGLVLTSKRAVDAIAQVIGTADDSRKLIDEWNANNECFVVGQSTAREASKIGFEPIGGESNSAEQLASLIVQRDGHSPTSSKPLFMPCSSIAHDRLPQVLRDAGVALEQLAVYDTAPRGDLDTTIEDALARHGNPDCAVLFSPSGVAALDTPIRQRFGVQFKQTRYVAIGGTTAEALSAHGYEVGPVPQRPDPKELALVLRRLFGTE